MSSVREPARRIPAPPPVDVVLSSGTEVRRRPRPAFLLAVVWVGVGAALYAAEILRLAGVG